MQQSIENSGLSSSNNNKVDSVTSKYTLDMIAKRTNLSENFLRRCITKFKPFFEAHTERGASNKSFYTSSGLVLFDQISQIKNGGGNLNEIEKKIFSKMQNPKEVVNNTMQNDYSSPSKQVNNTDFSLFLQNDKERQTLLLQEKDKNAELKEKVAELKYAIQSRDEKILLLTDGKTPEEAKVEILRKDDVIKMQKRDLEEKEEKLIEIYNRERDQKVILQQKTIEIEEKQKLMDELEVKANKVDTLKELLSKKDELQVKLDSEMDEWWVFRNRKKCVSLRLQLSEVGESIQSFYQKPSERVLEDLKPIDSIKVGSVLATSNTGGSVKKSKEKEKIAV